MKLKLININEKDKIIEISYWSFVKCYLLAWLGLVGIVYGVLITLGFVIQIFI